MVHKLIEAMENAIQDVRKWPDKTVYLFHHNDADGLSSGAILLRAFEREGMDVRRFCLEKPYPALLKQIYEKEGKILVFTDFAGRIAPMLSELNRGRNLTLILDHHVAEASTDPSVHNLDPDLFGLKGDRDISASTTCYLFARTLNPANRDLAHMAAIGAVGDGFFIDGRLVSQNREAVMEAVQQGRLEIETHDRGERYVLKSKTGDIPYDDLALYLEILGAAGYYQGGPDMGIRVCLEGKTPGSDRMVEDLKTIKDHAFNAEIEKLKNTGLKKSSHIQYFHVENRFSPMGVKMIGAFCHHLRNMEFIDPHHYIAGFQTLPDEIPGFGPIEFNEVKISMRVSPYLEDEIKAGRVPGLDMFLPEATNRLGGFSDACHSLAAATTVAIGREDQLIVEMEKILTSIVHLPNAWPHHQW
jgi:single-stranded-DNA-specific exonuclease